MTIARVRVGISGGQIIGSGLMTFYTRNVTPSGLPGAIKSFLASCASSIPAGLSFDVPNSGDTIDEVTGAIVGGWTGTGGAVQASSGTGAFTLGSGARVEWKTSVPFAGYHPRGRTFLVPLVNDAFGTNGRLASNTQTIIQGAANTLLTAGGGDLCVWVRPRKASVGKRGPLPARAGTNVPITSCSVPTTPTSLSSRRT